LILSLCDIGHDIEVGNHTILSPFCGLGEGIIFRECVYVGMQSPLKELLTIGDDAIVGIGTVVFRDVPTGPTVVGNLARITRGNDENKVITSHEKK